MDIFDFNIHLPWIEDPDVNKVIAQDMSMNVADLRKGLEINHSELCKSIGGNILLFNTALFDEDLTPFLEGFRSLAWKAGMLTALVDPRRADVVSYLENAASAGLGAIMFNSYLQQIGDSDFEAVLNCCREAERLGLMICIDGSYGTSRMFQYDNLKLACEVADQLRKAPVVVIHSGGLRVMQAALLAMDRPNVYLDTSFSLPFYLGSSLEQDYAFCYRKLGPERVLFGTDIPYMERESATRQQLDFFSRHKFSDAEIERIFHLNAMELCVR